MKIELRTPKFIRIPWQFTAHSVRTWRHHLIRSLRFRLILTFAACMVAGLIVSAITEPIFENQNRYAEINYENGMNEIDLIGKNMVIPYINELNLELKMAQETLKKDSKQEPHTKQPNSPDTVAQNQSVPVDEEAQDTDGLRIQNEKEYADTLQTFLNEQASHQNKKILIIDLNGKVLYKSNNAAETQVDIRSLIGQAMESRSTYSGVNYSPDAPSVLQYTNFYPIDLFTNQKMFLSISGSPRGDIVYQHSESSLPVVPGLITFFVLFYFLTKRKMNQIRELSDGLREIATGNLQYRVREASQDEIGSLAVNINQMAQELQQKIEEERQAEKVKNELITNVSHDLRTPLTTIMGYLRLLLDHKYETDEQVEEYVKITYGKSEKLKRLIDDLFEYTKLTSPGIRLKRHEVCLNELVDQLIEETVPLGEETGLAFVKEMTHERIIVNVDADKLVRVVDNLLTNAITYSASPNEIRVSLHSREHQAIVQIENYNDSLTDEEIPRLFERFYRADPSRSTAGGSGLGLAIAKSIIELHGGKIWAEREGNIIRFAFSLPL